MAIEDFVDWRGNPINRKVHGGFRAAWFVYGKSGHTKLLL
jgi:solute carrier family 15 (peptide/histidine transporter), member 3/4